MNASQESTEKRAGWKALLRRWRLIGYAVVWGLLLTIVLQNLEPTRIDVLFWSFAEVPKLILVLGSMAIGVVLWELGALLLGLRRARPRN